ncbi:phytanoyl-CoA dioxygenase family protein [Corallococcus llansteffanensis]|nr:phytanoyl-CoA dioxygenase family protein [Corallococcus llansteffanensis]
MLPAQLARMGYAEPISLLERAAIDRYRASFDESLAASGGKPEPHDLSGYHLKHRWAYELATTPALLDRISSVLGPDLVLWASHFWYKPPFSEDRVPWHCDAVYWPVLNRDIHLTAWIALSASDRGNGCLRMIPGSHRTVPHDTQLQDPTALSLPIADLEMAPGQVTFFSGYLFHGSEGNMSASPRIGYALRFSTPAVRFDEVQVKSGFNYLRSILVRGTDRYHHNDFMAAPPPF